MQYTNQYTKYLQLRNSTYYLRFKIPTHLRKLTPKQEIVRSLKTDSFNHACVIIATKFPLLRLLQKMTPTTNELQQLFDELTDFTDVDAYSSYQREATSPEIDGLRTVSEMIADDLKDNRLTDFTELTTTQPSETNTAQYKDFQRLFIRLLDAKVERAIHGCTVDFDALMNRASELVVEPKSEPKLLSVYFKKFADSRNWTDKIAKDNHNNYLFLLAHWGDVDITTITKKDIKSAIKYRALMPKGNVKPYNKMSVGERYLYPTDEISDDDFVAPKTAKELLRLLQGFFSSYLTKELDLFSVSPTDNVAYKIDDVRGGSYTDDEINKFIVEAHRYDDWRKWALLLAVYTGARRGEIVTFLQDGVKFDNDSELFYFEVLQGKTDSAKRQIPVHNELIDAGIISLPKIDIKAKLVTDFTNKMRDGLGIPVNDSDGNKRVFHSFRHSFITKAVSKGISKELVQEFVGHSKQIGITSRYIHKFSIADLIPVIQRVSY